MSVVFSPLKTRIIQMSMSVDSAREYVFSLCVDRLFCFNFGIGRQYSRDLAVLDRYAAFLDKLRCDDASVFD